MLFRYCSKMFFVPELSCSINLKLVIYFISNVLNGSSQLGETGKGIIFLNAFVIFGGVKSVGYM